MKKNIKGIIRFHYRKIINADSTSTWEKNLLHDTYAEFRMQSQLYNPGNQLLFFSEIVANAENPGSDVENHLNYLVSNAAIPYLKQLNEKMPDITANNCESALKFTQYRFRIQESNLLNIDQHVIALDFYSDAWQWIDTIGDLLLVAANGQQTTPVITQQFRLKTFFSIYSFEHE